MKKNTATRSMKNINVDSLIGHVLKLWSRSKNQILDEFGLTGPQYEILTALHDLSIFRKNITQMNLAKETGIDQVTASSLLHNLEKEHIITCTWEKASTRVKYIELTDSGRSLYKTASSKMANCCDNIYRNIDKENLTVQLLALSSELNKKKY